MSSNPRLKRLLYFDPDPSSRDSTAKTVNRVTTMLTRRETKRRLSSGLDPLTNVTHRIDVDVCLLGRRGLALAIRSPSLEAGAITKSYMLGGTRHENLPIHVSLNGSLDPIVVKSRLEQFESSLDHAQSVTLVKWVPTNLSSTTYLPVGGTLERFLSSLPDAWKSFRWKQRQDGSWFRQRVDFHLSM